MGPNELALVVAVDIVVVDAPVHVWVLKMAVAVFAAVSVDTNDLVSIALHDLADLLDIVTDEAEEKEAEDVDLHHDH